MLASWPMTTLAPLPGRCHVRCYQKRSLPGLEAGGTREYNQIHICKDGAAEVRGKL
jgi:hypothetical protein